MNICLCGAGAGYPHKKHCPYPLYRSIPERPEREQLWRDAYERNVNRRHQVLQESDDAERLDKWTF